MDRDPHETLELRDLRPPEQADFQPADRVIHGIPIPKGKRVEQFSSSEWEEFTEEWALTLDSYFKVSRVGGSGDKGIDVVGFITNASYDGGWDNYQCKHYDHALYPSDVWIEIGKIIYYCFKGFFVPPQAYYFVAPKGIGTTLANMLAKKTDLHDGLIENWERYCKDGISETAEIALEGELRTYVDQFDFSIFDSKPVAELIRVHADSPFHAVRFGGGLPDRPQVDNPPAAPAVTESRYIQQIFDAYSDYLGNIVSTIDELKQHETLLEDFLRQRIRFYHAESLRNFARDTVPEGTFDNLQEEIFLCIIDLIETEHPNGLERMRKTLTQAANAPVTANPLITVTKLQDKQGICHQLANEDRIHWLPSKT